MWRKADVFERFLLILLIGGVLLSGVGLLIVADKGQAMVSIAGGAFSAASALGAYMTVREVRRDRLERSQPSVVVEFRVRANSAIDFVLRNTSNNLAKNVTVTFDPIPIGRRGEWITSWAWLQNPLDLPPGAVEQSLFDMAGNFYKGESPRKFWVTVNCETEFGESCSPRTFYFDFGVKGDQVLPPKNTQDYAKDIAEELKQIRASIVKVTQWDSLLTEDRKEWIERIEREAKILQNKGEPTQVEPN